MSWLFERVKISARLFLLVALVAIGICGLLSLSYAYMRDALFEQNVNQARHLVQTTHSLIMPYVYESQADPAKLAEDQQRVLRRIGSLRYGKDGYFWINDMNGVMLTHPISSLVGQNLRESTDSKGILYMKNFINLVEAQGQGTETYYWPPTEGRQKISYVIGIPEWNWVVGSGVYFEDIELEIRAIFIKLALAAMTLLFVLLFFAILLGRSVSQPILSLSHILSDVAAGNLDVDVSLATRGDEIGSMAKATQVFVEHAQRVARIEAEKAEIDKAKSAFISVVSHELRTPLTSIRGSVELILGTMKTSLPEKALYLLNIAQSNIDRLLLLVNDLLDLDRIAAGEMRIESAPEQLGPLLRQAAEINRSYAEKYYARIHVTCGYQEETATINVDKARFFQVLSNLLSNAAKFSPAGGQILLSAEVMGDKVRIKVVDHGSGIPESFQNRVFQKFSQAQTEETKDRGGSGLGLHISQKLVELMKGRIGFETKNGIGTTFWVDFPLCSSWKEAP